MYCKTVKLTKKIFKLYELSVKEQVLKAYPDLQKDIDDNAQNFPDGIGYSPSKKCWAGWSHRAIHYFEVGDKLFDEKWTGGHTESELDKIPFKKRGDKTIKNMNDAKQAARNFALYVS